MEMTLDSLIDILNDYREEHGGETEVRLMTQMNYPFVNRIAGVTSAQEMKDQDSEEEGDEDPEEETEANIVYIVEGCQLSYGSKRAWDNPRTC